MATILVVDDEPANREFLTTVLGYAGHRTIQACDGAEALELARREHPDLAIVDLLMPTVDGFEFTRQLRIDPELAKTPVVFHSAAYTEDEIGPFAQKCGVYRVLPKPAEPEAVFAMIKEVLGVESLSSIPEPILAESLDQEHVRIITDKLVQKTTELEIANLRLSAMNAHLDQQIQERTVELARSNAELEQFAHAAAHDLQEPLRKIQGFLNLLSERSLDMLDDDCKGFIKSVLDAAERMQELIVDILDYSEVGTEHAPPSPADCEKVLQFALQDLDHRIKETGATIIHDQLPVILGDESELKRLFVNLIGNALKYRGQRPPTIQISAKRTDTISQFSICDNGIGIEPQFDFRTFSGS